MLSPSSLSPSLSLSETKDQESKTQSSPQHSELDSQQESETQPPPQQTVESLPSEAESQADNGSPESPDDSEAEKIVLKRKHVSKKYELSILRYPESPRYSMDDKDSLSPSLSLSLSPSLSSTHLLKRSRLQSKTDDSKCKVLCRSSSLARRPIKKEETHDLSIDDDRTDNLSIPIVEKIDHITIHDDHLGEALTILNQLLFEVKQPPFNIDEFERGSLTSTLYLLINNRWALQHMTIHLLLGALEWNETFV
jgi:hypothetical protein